MTNDKRANIFPDGLPMLGSYTPPDDAPKGNVFAKPEKKHVEYPKIQPPMRAQRNMLLIQLPIPNSTYGSGLLVKTDEQQAREDYLMSMGKIVSVGPLAFMNTDPLNGFKLTPWAIEAPKLGDMVKFAHFKVVRIPYRIPGTNDYVNYTLIEDRDVLADMPIVELIEGIRMGVEKQ